MLVVPVLADIQIQKHYLQKKRKKKKKKKDLKAEHQLFIVWCKVKSRKGN